jgi:hypothetical protein
MTKMKKRVIIEKRACGYVFCKKCSKEQINLDYMNDAAENKRHRVCDVCYDYMFNTFKTKLPSMDQLNYLIYKKH